MQHLTVDAKATATELGEFEAIAATWSVDRQNEQIRRGAFKKTIARWQASGRRIPVHWNHGAAAADIIGTVDPRSMRETVEGLHVKGKLDLEGSEVAREAWRSMKANAVALSFGYMAVGQRDRSDGVRELTEIDLYEVSITAAPANADTRIVALKSMAAALPPALVGTSLGPMVTGEPLDHKAVSDAMAERKAYERKRMPIQVARFEC